MNHDHNSGGDDMAHCAEVYESLFELLDGEVTAQRRQLLVAHLEACPACFEKLGIEKEVRDLIRRCCVTCAPLSLKERIVIQLRIQSGRSVR